MKKLSLYLLFGLFLFNGINAQNNGPTYHDDANNKEILDVLDRYKKALIDLDKETFHSLFYDQIAPIFGVYKEKGKGPYIRLHAATFIDRFVWEKKNISQKFWNVKVRSDAVLGVLSADFEFYYGKEITNWGTESWHLIKTEDGWKILAITYSSHPTEERKKWND